MTSETKRRAILFLILTALITVMLAVALPQLELQKGIPLPGGNGQAGAAGQAAGAPSLSINLSTFLKAALVLFVLMVVIYLFIKRGQPLGLRDLGQVLAGLAAVSLILSFLTYSLSNVRISLMATAVEILPPEVALVAAPLPVTALPSSLLWLVWVALAGLVLLLATTLLRVRLSAREAQDPLAFEAEQAVAALKVGQDFSNVIIHCYQQMSQVLQQEQGLTLKESMTAREFEALLEKRGVPNPPVRQLTQLFEIARYAAQAPGPAEEARAIDCLNAIAQYSQNKRRGQRG